MTSYIFAIGLHFLPLGILLTMNNIAGFLTCFLVLQAFPDNAARREVESLPAICNNSDCSWRGTIKEYEVGCVVLSLLCNHGLKPGDDFNKMCMENK